MDAQGAMSTEVRGERRTERIRLETDRHLIVGDITLPPDGYQSRFSDALNRPDRAFLPLVNVEIVPLAGGEVETLPFVAVSKSHVRIASPLGEPA
jgi:hypothetical protein